MTVTVAIPVLNGGPLLEQVLGAVRRQELDRPLELVVADSGSTDGSRSVAEQHGARVLEVPPGEFSHGGTRNMLVEHSSGEHVAFLTQDALPASERWLAALLSGFELGPDVGLVYGPYRARGDASHMVRRELREFFAGLAPDGRPRVDRVEPGGRLERRPGAKTFFTDANGCVSRAAWERVPLRDVPYAEDQQLATDMLEAGFAKVFVPDAAVIHSHDYPALERFRRFFDEFRGLHEVYGHVEPVGLRRTPEVFARQVARDLRFVRAEGTAGTGLARAALSSASFHATRAVGAALGSRAERLPASARRWCSLERRA